MVLGDVDGTGVSRLQQRFVISFQKSILSCLESAITVAFASSHSTICH